MDWMSYFMGMRDPAAGGGTSDYAALSNKPSIGGVTLSGNKTAEDLGLVAVEAGKGLSTNDFTDDNKVKLSGIAEGAEVNVIDGMTVNGDAVPVAGKTAVLNMPTKVSDLTNDAGYQDAQQVEDAINVKVSSAYKAGGSATMATLPALTATKLGTVVNMSENFTTTTDFLEGAGKTYPAGTNVVVAIAGENVYKYDVLAGFVDLSGKQDKLPVTGAANRGVYVSVEGVVSAMSHTLDKDVPADAALTDTVTEVDDTLSNSGQAADAKTTGDNLAALRAENTLLRELVNGIDAPIYRKASGNPATFADGYATNVKALSVTLTPTQSGSGDPYPPGGGKNLFNYNAWKSVAVNNGTGVFENYGVTITATARDCYTYFQNNTYPAAARIPVTEGETYILSWECDTIPSEAGVILFPNGAADKRVGATDPNQRSIEYTATEGITYLTFRVGTLYDGTTFAVRNIMVRNASETDPTFAPYSNVRPISGVSSVSVRRYGKNLFPQNTVSIPFHTGNTEVSFPENLHGGIYTFSANVSSSYQPTADANDGCLVHVLYINGAFAQHFLSPNARGSFTINSGVEITGVRFYCANTYTNSYNNSGTFTDIQFESGSVATDYQPHDALAVPLTDSNGDPLTVYGGTLNVTTGELTVTRKMVTLTGEETWVMRQGGQRYDTSSSSFNAFKTDGSALCSHAVWSRSNNVALGHFYINQNLLIFQDNAAIFADASAFSVWLANQSSAGSPVQVLGELATPIKYTLTPAQLATLSGYNSVATDAGTLSVTYRADPAITLGGG